MLPTSSAAPIGSPIQPSHGKIAGVVTIETATQDGPHAGQQIAEVLADAHPE
jgi:hypothetical protein